MAAIRSRTTAAAAASSAGDRNDASTSSGSYAQQQQQPLLQTGEPRRPTSAGTGAGLWSTGIANGNGSGAAGKAATTTSTASAHYHGLGTGLLGFGLGPGEVKLLIGLTVLAAFVRLWKLGQPSSVVFDEVHFGGFASKYIKQKFFMDVHPPLAKMMIALSGWLAGFDGEFDFKDIGKEYLIGEHTPVPYVAMRGLCALLGLATVPLAYLTLRGLSLRPTTALVGSTMVLFENALMTQSRYILLDSHLVFFTALTALAWSASAARTGAAPRGTSPRAGGRGWWASESAWAASSPSSGSASSRSRRSVSARSSSSGTTSATRASPSGRSCGISSHASPALPVCPCSSTSSSSPSTLADSRNQAMVTAS